MAFKICAKTLESVAMETENPHIVAVPFPSQGHVNPLMHISQKLAKNGVKVTVVNTDFIHSKVVGSMGDLKDSILSSHIELVSVPDGFGPDESRYAVDKLFYRLMATLRPQLRDLLSKIENKHNACVLVDLNMAWVLEVAHDLGIRGVVFSSFSAAHCAINLCIPKLIRDGIIDAQGIPMKEQKFQLGPGIPHMNTVDLPWRSHGYKHEDTKKLFEYLARQGRGLELAKWYLINTTYDLEPEAVSLSPKILSIGPLAASQAGQFWKEDDSCLAWLDQHPPNSVLFVAFGSSTRFGRAQFQELALGLELTGRPFLWAVRPGEALELPEGFEGKEGKIIGWAPQQQVLNHPALACFVSHCGWSSTLEGLSSGVPFLCRPYYGDQFTNRNYLCDVWKVGFGLEKDENGVVSRWEIQRKVEELLGNEDIRARCVELKEKIRRSADAGGTSSNNFDKFIEWLRSKNEV